MLLRRLAALLACVAATGALWAAALATDAWLPSSDEAAGYVRVCARLLALTALGELALATKTLQRTMIDKGLCSADEFAAKLRQIDLEDGRAGGRTPLP